MDTTEALNILSDALLWNGSATLQLTLATLCALTYIWWFTWVVTAQLARLRANEIEIDQMLAICARALLVVFAAMLLVGYLTV